MPEYYRVIANSGRQGEAMYFEPPQVHQDNGDAPLPVFDNGESDSDTVGELWPSPTWSPLPAQPSPSVFQPTPMYADVDNDTDDDYESDNSWDHHPSPPPTVYPSPPLTVWSPIPFVLPPSPDCAHGQPGQRYRRKFRL